MTGQNQLSAVQQPVLVHAADVSTACVREAFVLTSAATSVAAYSKQAKERNKLPTPNKHAAQDIVNNLGHLNI